MKKAKTQQQELRSARERLKISNAELAERLGVSEPTILSWLAPNSAAKHRVMPRQAKLLLAAILRARKE